MWDDKKHEKTRCACGVLIAACQRTRHDASRWHVAWERAAELRARGVTPAEIARQLRLTRAYVGQRLKGLAAEPVGAKP